MYVCRDMHYNDVHQYGIYFMDVETPLRDASDPNGYNVLNATPYSYDIPAKNVGSTA